MQINDFMTIYNKKYNLNLHGNFINSCDGFDSIFSPPF